LGAGGIAGAGLGFAGAQAGIQGTFGLFCGSNEGPHLGGNVSGAAFAYAGGHHVGAPEADSNGNLGAAAGAGASVWFSNAKTAEQLRSNLHAVDLTAGYRIGISVNYQWDDNGTWILSVTPPVPYNGATIGAMVSKYTSNTFAWFDWGHGGSRWNP
jgi:hypothetical protein